MPLRKLSFTVVALTLCVGVVGLAYGLATKVGSDDAPTATTEEVAPQTPQTQTWQAPARNGSDGGSNADLNVPIPGVRLEKVFTADSWRRPTQIVARPDDGDLLVVLEQGGRIQTVRRSTPREASTPFVDLSDRVSFGTNEEGLLSLCFHPRFTENLEFFVYYSAARPRRTVLSRLKAVRGDDGAILGDPASEQVILEVPQPFWNHNGGTVLFGPDGMLYLSIGDGGAAGDPRNFGQDLSSLLGSVIRIDVDRTDEGKAYAIPSDNPFVDRDGALAEIWAWGLRNVWRMSFDSETGLLWGGDVGQNRWEEINVIVRGGNYGWRLREGRRAFVRGGEERGDMIDPVIEYPRRDGLSVTGGHVYRGSAVPEWQGVYFYADYNYGTIWGARTSVRSQGDTGGGTGGGTGGDTSHARGPAEVGPIRRLVRQAGLHISSFGEALDGELFLCGFEGSERGPGGLYRLVPTRVPSGR